MDYFRSLTGINVPYGVVTVNGVPLQDPNRGRGYYVTLPVNFDFRAAAQQANGINFFSNSRNVGDLSL